MKSGASRLTLAIVAILAFVSAGCQQADQTVDERAATPSPPPDVTEATVTIVESDLGMILADSEGRTVYLFMNDTAGESTCYDACQQRWPPLAIVGDPVAGEGVNAALLGSNGRRDGSTQATYNGHPLYRFSEDQAPGDTNGQGVGNLWFAVSPEGEPVRS